MTRLLLKLVNGYYDSCYAQHSQEEPPNSPGGRGDSFSTAIAYGVVTSLGLSW